MHPQQSPSRQDCSGRTATSVVGLLEMHGNGGKGIKVHVSEAVSETETTPQHTWLGKASQRRGRNVLLRFITYKQSLCSLWRAGPLQTNCNNEIQIILADFALQ